MKSSIERNSKWLFIGGDGATFPVVEQGANFIGIPDRRFEWAEWDGATDPETHEKAERLSGRDIAGIAQLTADADGRIAVDKANRPDGKFMCVVWAADGRARFLQTLKVTEYGADETQTRRATLPRQEPAEQAQDESPKGNSCPAETTAEKETVVVETQEVTAVESQETSNAEAWEMWHRLDERLARIEVGVDAGNAQGANTHAVIQYLVAKRKAAEQRRQTIARETRVPRGKAGDEIDWDEYEVCRAIDNQLKNARKEKRRLTQVQASERVIESYNRENERIQCRAETLATYYRRWKKRRNKNRTD